MFSKVNLALGLMAASTTFASPLIPSALTKRQYTGGDLSGCGISHDFAGQSQLQTNFCGGSRCDRQYLVHLPSDYDENKQYPMILAFHGSGVPADYCEGDYGFSDQFNDDKIIVYPQGIDNSWGGPSYASVDAQEDLDFINDLLTHLRTRYCLDSARIYATGHSNGGGFVGTMACDATVGANFAAFAPVSGAFYTDVGGPDNGCSPARPVMPILEMHGVRDSVIGYYSDSGRGGDLPEIPDWVSSWASRNGCDDPTVEDTFDNDVHHSSYNCSGVPAALQHYKIDSLEHVWVSTEVIPDDSHFNPNEQPAPIEGSQIILDFFNANYRPA